MARQLRKQMKRKAAQSVRHSQHIVESMMFLRDIFAESHEEYVDAFDLIINNQLMQIDFIISISTRAWGTFPNDLDRWLK